MKRFNSLLILPFIMLLTLLCSYYNQAAAAPDGIQTVCGTGCDHTSIQAAVNSALSGDIIEVLDPVHVESGIIVSKSLVITGQGQEETILQANDQPLPYNGRIFLVDIDTEVIIQKMTIRYGGVASGFGGGIYNEGELALINVNISDNQAGASGGGIYSNGPLEISGSTISNNSTNQAFGGGGGIFAELNTVNIDSSTISGNVAAYGGGIFFRNGVDLSIVNSTLSGNRAEGSDPVSDGGGAIDVLHNLTPTVSIAFSTISGNSSKIAGRDGLWLEAGEATIEATILNNENGNCYKSGGFVSSGGYNIESADSCSFNAPGDMVNKELHIAPLANNGGPTETHWLLPASPALDAIPLFVCQQNQDQRGAPRPKHHGCDVGSVEVNYKTSIPVILK